MKISDAKSNNVAVVENRLINSRVVEISPEALEQVAKLLKNPPNPHKELLQEILDCYTKYGRVAWEDIEDRLRELCI